MPFIPVPNVIQAELVYNWGGETCENVFHFEPDAGVPLALMPELGAHLISWWNTNMRQWVNVTAQLVAVKFTDLTASIDPAMDVVTGLPIIGTAAGDSLPNNVSCVFSKRTILRGRSYRGRIYQIGLSEQHVTANALLATPRDGIKNAYQMLTAFSTAGASWTMVVVSRYQAGAPRAVGVTTNVTSITTDGVIDSQRRRLPGRGT